MFYASFLFCEVNGVNIIAEEDVHSHCYQFYEA